MDGLARPELVFLTGPQAGERAVVMGSPALVGRSPAADVRVQEESVSREQVRFSLMPEGWVMENLSAHGTLVNGKRCRKRKKLLLETGDVLGLGVETQVLYVAPGDDPEAALAAWHEAHPAPPPEPTKPATGQAPARDEAAKAAEGDEAAEGAEGAAAKPKGKLKYLLFALLLVGVGIVALALIARPKEGGDGQPGPTGLARLDANAIEDALATVPKRPFSLPKSIEELALARRMFPDRLRARGDSFRCVRHFQLSLAYRDAHTFDSIQDERNYGRALKELVAQVRDKYDTAWRFERAMRWTSAQATYEQLREVLPPAEMEHTAPEYTVVFRNILDHIDYVKRRVKEERNR